MHTRQAVSGPRGGGGLCLRIVTEGAIHSLTIIGENEVNVP